MSGAHDEGPLVGQPPAWHVADEVFEQVGRGGSASRFRHDGHQRPFGPLRVGDGDHRGLEHVGMAHHRILELDRRDPLAAGLDDVLGAVRDGHVTLAVERADVAGAEPAVVELRWVLVLVVRARDPRPADLDSPADVPSLGSTVPSSATTRTSTPPTTRPALTL